MRMTYLALYLRILGHTTHKYAKDIELDFEGFKPITWSDAEYNYVAGLPTKVHKGSISVQNKNNDSKFHFDSGHGVINWEGFFSNIPTIVYHDDLD